MFLVNDDKPVEHRAEDRLHTEFSLVDAVDQLALSFPQIFQAETDSACTLISPEEKCWRGAIARDRFDQLFSPAPWRYPKSPDYERERH
jgi:hypothetical protein